MKFRRDTIIFEPCDMAFVKKVGFMEAADLAASFHVIYPSLPFLNDADQLAALFAKERGPLEHFVRHINEKYCPIIMLKRGGKAKRSGKARHLNVPGNELNRMQRIINRRILSKLSLSEYATAYRKGGSVQHNANPHVGKHFILKLDITDFFGSIRFGQVYAAFHAIYDSKQVSYLLASLCCRDNVLPQGASTSPALSNLVMANFDNKIGTWCRDHNISYTRYCDDMTFSADSPLYSAYQKAKELLCHMGFELNEDKTHFISSGSRQSVTGLTVNKKLSVSNDYKRELRQEVYFTLKFGAADSIIKGSRTDYILDGKPETKRYLYHLLGKVQYVLWVEPDKQWFQDAKRSLEEMMRRLKEDG